MKTKLDRLKQNWFVISQLVDRDNKRSLSSTYMGELWEIINPLINMIVMVLVFGKMLGTGNAFDGFPLYVLTGQRHSMDCLRLEQLCVWMHCLGKKIFLIKTKINKNIYILEKIVSAFRNFMFSLMIYIFVIALYRIQPDVTWILFVIDVVLLFFMMLGIGKVLAVINVTLADITYFYKIFTLMLMYGSAIFYRVDRLSPIMQKIMMVNPLYIVITIARNCVMDNIYPNWKLWMILSVYAGGCYVIGTIFFNKRIDDIVAKL
ncbi:MAG: ABC transporter permease [Roseburia faecis]